MTDFEQVLHDYTDFWHDLTPDTVGDIHPLLHDDVRFIDPFNNIQGRVGFEKVLAKIFHDCRAVVFDALDHGWSATPQALEAKAGAVAYLRWQYRALPKKRDDWWVLNGVTELHFCPEGKLLAHIDHWDSASQIFPKFPMLRQIWGFVQRKMCAT